MVVREDGTKWACQSCLKGHRVSGCTHTDRELKLVPKKGRPVTQCQHCRQERKKRSAHVKCDCGEDGKPHHSKEKCVHLREQEERAKANGFFEDQQDEAGHLSAVAEEQGTCCCHHTGTCTCATMKNDDGDVTPPHGRPAVNKPRLESTKSDGSLTVFANGHHKPVHRKNNLAHECGMPYKMPMPRAHTDQSISRAAARRSVDSLALDTTFSADVDQFNQMSGQQFNPARRLSKSEQASPKLSKAEVAKTIFNNCSGGLSDSQYTSVDFSTLDQVRTNDTMQSAVSEASGFPSFDPMSGVADGSFDPWSSYPSADSAGVPNNNPFGVWPTRTDVNGMAQPALTAASSGTQSEVDEIPAMEDVYEPGMPSIQEDVSNFDFESALANNSPQSNRRSLPPNFFGNTDFGIPPLDTNWQSQIGGLDDNSDAKSKSTVTSQPMFDDSWQMSAVPTTTDMPFRNLGGLPLAPSGRPSAHSVGPGSAPNDDLIRQLFPGMDFESGNNFDSAVNAQSLARTQAKPNTSFPSNMDTDFDSFADNSDSNFTSQAWTDGSISVPNDPYTSSFSFDQDYSDPTIQSNWSQ